MADTFAECFSTLCGACCIAISSTITQWSNTSRMGAEGLCCCCCGRNTGCCGLCCNKSFDEDGFEEEVQKDIAKTRDSNAPAEQPKASPDMAVPAPNSKEPPSIDKEETTINKEEIEIQKTEAQAQGASSADSPKTDVKLLPS